MHAATLYRASDDGKQTLGRMVIQGVELKTLELPWRDNQTDISCIPAGTYLCLPRKSKAYGRHYHVHELPADKQQWSFAALLHSRSPEVPGRSMILIHAGNYHTNTLGCILVGLAHADINADGLADVTSSRKALDKLLSIAPDGFKLTIRAYNPAT